MKVFYSASISRTKKLLPVSQDLVKYIENLGHTVITKHLVDPKYSEDPNWDRQHDGQEVYQDAEEKLKNADVLISECTVPSFGAAFWIDKCLEMKKPLLSLHYGLSYDYAPLMLQGSKDKINLKMYTEDNAPHVLKSFLEKV